jgi:hypothetical protein
LRTFELAPITGRLLPTETALRVNFFFDLLFGLRSWHLLHAPIKQIVLSFPEASIGEGLDVALYSAAEFIYSFGLEIGVDCRHLV